MNVLVIPDTHAPFAHPNALDFLRDLKAEHRPNRVVHIGDLGDAHGWSRHDRHPDSPGQGDEDAECLAWCKQLYKLFPKVSACVGNHDTRLIKQAQRAGIPSRLVASIRGQYESPRGWEWKRFHVIDGTHFSHGDAKGGQYPAQNIARELGCSVAIGHHHALAGVSWFRTPLKTFFAMSVGCLVDEDSLAFDYARASIRRSCLGAGVILDGEPRFIPLEK